MNNNLMPLKELLTDKKYNDITKCEVEYLPSEKENIISLADTGISKKSQKFFEVPEQVFKTENFIYNPVLDENNNPCLISKGVTKKLYLMGITGYKNSLVLMKKICELYNSQELNAKGKLVTEKLLEILPEHLLQTTSLKDVYYINKKYTDEYTTLVKGNNEKSSCCFLYVCNNGKIEPIVLGGVNCATWLFGASIRPVIELPSDIIVDTKEIDNKKLTLSLNRK